MVAAGGSDIKRHPTSEFLSLPVADKILSISDGLLRDGTIIPQLYNIPDIRREAV